MKSMPVPPDIFGMWPAGTEPPHLTVPLTVEEPCCPTFYGVCTPNLKPLPKGTAYFTRSPLVSLRGKSFQNRTLTARASRNYGNCTKARCAHCCTTTSPPTATWPTGPHCPRQTVAIFLDAVRVTKTSASSD